ncbi:uncharacterized protein LOC112454958 isoform X2 [Temnothorax curvispinosus]|uniref:Uncharacterized protein LOC112454958 isoform X2 n=1 Tax=Temnothorax curvispinosus TaxID=300111 RepID=A0A6J1PT01_9HYME|nr:uncharacterized protein LOC112454958 isoform X2 [Temnothorax curvispinosus]
MLNYTFIPFLLALNASVPEGTSNVEYTFHVNKTTVVYSEPLQITQLTAVLICQPLQSKTTLLCFLRDVMTLSTLKYQNSNITEEVSKENIKSEQWFGINFNERGVQDIIVNMNIEKIIKEEKTPIGTCTTKYNMDILYGQYERNEKQESKFQVIPLALAKHFAKQNDTHVRVTKTRQNCKYSRHFLDFLNGMEVNEYFYSMEIDDKLKISTTMDVQLPSDPWNPSGSSVFTDKIQLNLTDIRSLQIAAMDMPHTFITLTL